MKVNYNHQCKSCPLHESALSVCVDGTGNQTADVMFVGTNPDIEDDESSVPYSGEPGQYLIGLLAKYGISGAFFTHVAKCRPPDKKQPKKAEMLACSQYLEAEIQMCKPKVVVPMGALPLSYFKGRQTKISDFAGRPTDAVSRDFVLFPVMNYLQPFTVAGSRIEFEGQIAQLAKFIKGEPDLEPNWEKATVDTITAFFKGCKGPVSFDYETTGLHPWTDEVRTVAYGYKNQKDEYKALVLDLEDPVMEEYHTKFLISDIPKIAHNATFEVSWSLYKWEDYPIKNIIADTMLLYYLVDEEAGTSLHSLSRLTPWSGYDDSMNELKKDPTFSWGTVGFEILARYNGGDAIVTRYLYDLIMENLGQPQKDLHRNIHIPAIYTLSRIRNRGMQLSPSRLRQAKEELRCQMDSFINTAHLEAETTFNLDSPIQISQILYDKLNLPILKKTPKRNPSTDEEALKLLLGRTKNKVVEAVIGYRKLSTLWKSYATQLENLSHNWVLHGEYRINGTVTGQLTTSKPNLLAIPGKGPIPKCFVSRFPNGQILSADYSRLELALVANYSQDEGMMNAVQPDKDAHAEAAAVLFNKDIEKITYHERQKAKRMNFGLIFGLTVHGMTKDGYTQKEAFSLISRYNNAFPKVYELLQGWSEEARETGKVVSPTGQIRHLPDVYASEAWIKEKACRQAANFPIQNVDRLLTLWATSVIDTRLMKSELNSIVIGSVHDSVIVDLYPGETDKVVAIIKNVMENEYRGVFPHLTSQLYVDLEVGPSWGEKEELKPQNEKRRQSVQRTS